MLFQEEIKAYNEVVPKLLPGDFYRASFRWRWATLGSSVGYNGFTVKAPNYFLSALPEEAPHYLENAGFYRTGSNT